MVDSHDRHKTNRLAKEASVYLRQHMYNPVDWHPWGQEALLYAQKEDKPILLSIGYSACHWCHVMEKESFEDIETAKLMNQWFVNIKIDREERPDIDHIYMDTVVNLTGHGGWPLTVFCDPRGRPFYAGTYFPPDSRHGLPAFRQVLEAVGRAYGERRDEVEETASQIVQALSQKPEQTSTSVPGVRNLRVAATLLLKAADMQNGGIGKAPKFPNPTNIELLLTATGVTEEKERMAILNFVTFTCHEMARRGLYDQIGGGFHRYCVDQSWGIPHFEKMLYDQGQLLRIYSEAWRQGGMSDDNLVWPVRETARYLERELSVKDGGFAASQDADSEGIEGKFYTWSMSEIGAALTDEAKSFCDAYGLTEEGNFEGKTVLWDISRDSRSKFERERNKLYQLRTKRIWPGRDEKRIAAWNALAASGLAAAGSLLEDSKILDQAISTGDFLLDRMRDENGMLYRVRSGAENRIPGFLDDLACTLCACLDLYRAGAGPRFANAALSLANNISDRFFEPDEEDLYLTSKDGETLIVRPRSDNDGATPHSAGLAVLGLLRTSMLSGETRFRDIALLILKKYAYALEQSPVSFPTLLRAGLWDEKGLSCAVVVGEIEDSATQALATRARRILSLEELVIVTSPDDRLPEGVSSLWTEGRTTYKKPTAFICQNTLCGPPVTDPADLIPITWPTQI